MSLPHCYHQRCWVYKVVVPSRAINISVVLALLLWIFAIDFGLYLLRLSNVSILFPMLRERLGNGVEGENTSDTIWQS